MLTWGTLVYMQITSKVTVSVSSSASLGHLIKKFKLSGIKLLMPFKKGFDVCQLTDLFFLLGTYYY